MRRSASRVAYISRGGCRCCNCGRSPQQYTFVVNSCFLPMSRSITWLKPSPRHPHSGTGHPCLMNEYYIYIRSSELIAIYQCCSSLCLAESRTALRPVSVSLSGRHLMSCASIIRIWLYLCVHEAPHINIASLIPHHLIAY
jgi:hypothetical protein